MSKPKVFVSVLAVLLVTAIWACESAVGGEIVAWGANNYGQCDVPDGNDFVASTENWMAGVQ